MLSRSFLNGNLLILDGGLGTELESRGYNVNHKLWSSLILSKDPTAIYQLHKDYFNAGANIIISSSYQASIRGFLESGISSSSLEASKLITKSVEIAKEARDDYLKEMIEQGKLSSCRSKPLLVAASIGPYGAYLGTGAEYNGDYGNITKTDLIHFHKPRIEAIIKGNPDLIALETIPRRDEIEVLVNLLSILCNDIPFWLSLSLRNTNELPELPDGSTIVEIVDLVRNIDSLIAIGANCYPIQNTSLILDNFHLYTNLPLIVYPNSGETYNAVTKTWSNKLSPESLHRNWETWYNKGARIIGGCCRTSPTHINQLSNSISNS